jgi:glyoxylase-like metal-dependent hydrolase (beta-lactamase superfamily II)
MRKIIEGLVQVGTAVNVFLLETDPGELTVLDTGMPGNTRAILRAAAELGYQPQDIKNILITHADVDHAGSAAGLQQATGARVYAGEETANYLREGMAPPHNAAMNWFMGPMQSLMIRAMQVNQVLHDGQVLPIGGGIEAIFAPGHTPDNFCYYWQREHVLFAPDLFFAATGSLGLTPSMISWDMERARQSAQRVMARTPQIICVGHGPSFDLAVTPEAASMLVTP